MTASRQISPLRRNSAGILRGVWTISHSFSNLRRAKLCVFNFLSHPHINFSQLDGLVQTIFCQMLEIHFVGDFSVVTIMVTDEVFHENGFEPTNDPSNETLAEVLS